MYFHEFFKNLCNKIKMPKREANTNKKKKKEKKRKKKKKEKKETK